MRFLKKIVPFVFITLISFIGFTLISTGFFRTIEPQFAGEIFKTLPIKGGEDLTISYSDSFALISSTNRAFYPPKTEEFGGLLYVDLKSEAFQMIPLKFGSRAPFAPHGISMFKKKDGYQVMAINHTAKGHSIEVFELHGKTLKHLKTLTDPAMIQPNDLVMIDSTRFYFTNDHGYVKGLGKLAEEYLGLARSTVIYFDGKSYRTVAKQIAYANGINVDQTRNLLYVASARGFLVNVYTIQQDGSLSFIEDIPCKTGVDNIELDQDGHLWIGAHPNLLRFQAYAKGNEKTAPSEIIKIDYREKGDYTVDKIYVSDGTDMSASSVAAPFGDLIMVGNVMDNKVLILKQE